MPERGMPPTPTPTPLAVLELFRVKTLPVILLWAGGGGAAYTIYLLGRGVVGSVRHTSRWVWYGTKVLVRSFQRCWHLWMSSPSWRLRWSTSSAVPLLSPELLLTVLCLRLL